MLDKINLCKYIVPIMTEKEKGIGELTDREKLLDSDIQTLIGNFAERYITMINGSTEYVHEGLSLDIEVETIGPDPWVRRKISITKTFSSTSVTIEKLLIGKLEATIYNIHQPHRPEISYEEDDGFENKLLKGADALAKAKQVVSDTPLP